MTDPELQVVRIPEQFAVAVSLAPEKTCYLSFHETAASAEQMLQSVRAALDAGTISLSQLERPIANIEPAPAIDFKTVKALQRFWQQASS
ncbi:MAG: hypothetical protein KME17_23770 [Cyanosarcina radialis HA8281-LM2]|jgi:hypothetical protein|nr:hypothetical protein [Cyanosarcina radialis HA8281-LM2]